MTDPTIDVIIESKNVTVPISILKKFAFFAFLEHTETYPTSINLDAVMEQQTLVLWASDVLSFMNTAEVLGLSPEYLDEIPHAAELNLPLIESLLENSNWLETEIMREMVERSLCSPKTFRSSEMWAANPSVCLPLSFLEQKVLDALNSSPLATVGLLHQAVLYEVIQLGKVSEEEKESKLRELDNRVWPNVQKFIGTTMYYPIMLWYYLLSCNGVHPATLMRQEKKHIPGLRPLITVNALKQMLRKYPTRVMELEYSDFVELVAWPIYQKTKADNIWDDVSFKELRFSTVKLFKGSSVQSVALDDQLRFIDMFEKAFDPSSTAPLRSFFPHYLVTKLCEIVSHECDELNWLQVQRLLEICSPEALRIILPLIEKLLLTTNAPLTDECNLACMREPVQTRDEFWTQILGKLIPPFAFKRKEDLIAISLTIVLLGKVALFAADVPTFAPTAEDMAVAKQMLKISPNPEHTYKTLFQIGASRDSKWIALSMPFSELSQWKEFVPELSALDASEWMERLPSFIEKILSASRQDHDIAVIRDHFIARVLVAYRPDIRLPSLDAENILNIAMKCKCNLQRVVPPSLGSALSDLKRILEAFPLVGDRMNRVLPFFQQIAVSTDLFTEEVRTLAEGIVASASERDKQFDELMIVKGFNFVYRNKFSPRLPVAMTSDFDPLSASLAAVKLNPPPFDFGSPQGFPQKPLPPFVLPITTPLSTAVGGSVPVSLPAPPLPLTSATAPLNFAVTPTLTAVPTATFASFSPPSSTPFSPQSPLITSNPFTTFSSPGSPGSPTSPTSPLSSVPVANPFLKSSSGDPGDPKPVVFTSNPFSASSGASPNEVKYPFSQ